MPSRIPRHTHPKCVLKKSNGKTYVLSRPRRLGRARCSQPPEMGFEIAKLCDVIRHEVVGPTAQGSHGHDTVARMTIFHLFGRPCGIDLKLNILGMRSATHQIKLTIFLWFIGAIATMNALCFHLSGLQHLSRFFVCAQ